MAEVFFDNPPNLNGREAEQLRQLQAYLTAMSEKLNVALANISIEQLQEETREQIRGANAAEKVQQATESLKSLIIKTAEIVRHEMDVISVTLNDEYEALSSQFGAYERDLQSTITATAEGILQEYNYEERVTGLEDEAGNTDVFIRKLNQYIFSGLVDSVNGKYGIAVGENVTAYDANGNPYLNDGAKCATFTMDELAFFQGGDKVAYISNSTLFIQYGEITKSLKIGNHTWTTFTDGSMALVAG